MNIDVTGKLNEWTLFTYKHLFGLTTRKTETLGKSMHLTFWVPVPEVVEVIT